MDLSDARFEEFCDDVDRRIEAFLRDQERRRRGFVTSDLSRVRELFVQLSNEPLVRGPLFIEWGSGVGGVATLAALVGFESCGIEIQPLLVDSSRELCHRFGANAEFACGTYVPPDDEELFEQTEYDWDESSAGDGHVELGRSIDDFDVIYAYPWPWEEEAVDLLFQRRAAPGAVLITNHGSSGFRLLEHGGHAARWL